MIAGPGTFAAWRDWARQVQQVLNPFMTRVETSFFRQGQVLRLARHAVADLPDPGVPGAVIYVSDESGGAVPAFSDGTNWRRVTDRAVVS